MNENGVISNKLNGSFPIKGNCINFNNKDTTPLRQSPFMIKMRGDKLFKRIRLDEFLGILKSKDKIYVEAMYRLSNTDGTKYLNSFYLSFDGGSGCVTFDYFLCNKGKFLFESLDNVYCTAAHYCNLLVSGASNMKIKGFLVSSAFPSYVHYSEEESMLIRIFISDNIASYVDQICSKIKLNLSIKDKLSHFTENMLQDNIILACDYIKNQVSRLKYIDECKKEFLNYKHTFLSNVDCDSYIKLSECVNQYNDLQMEFVNNGKYIEFEDILSYEDYIIELRDKTTVVPKSHNLTGSGIFS